MDIAESVTALKAQLKALETERKGFEKQANLTRKKEVKVRQAIANLSALSTTTASPAQ